MGPDGYGPKCDVWSCGVIAYIIMCGSPPFHGSTDFEIIKKVKAGKYSFPPAQWGKVSDECKNFIGRMLTKDPDERPSAGLMLQDPWIMQASTAQLEKLDTEVTHQSLNNLQKFQADSKLKQATFSYIAAQLLSKAEKQRFD